MPEQQIQPINSQFILYQDDNGVTNVNVRFDGKDVWLAQQQIAMLFDTTRENVVQHIQNIYQDGELQEEQTCKKFLQVQTEGAGVISHEQAVEKATKEFEYYRRKEMLQYESDFDRAIKELKSQEDKSKKEP